MIDGKIRGMAGALISLRPGAQWSMTEEDYDSIIWLEPESGMTKPSLEEVHAEIARLDSVYSQYDYQRKRSIAYPPFAEQFDLLYHGGYDAWKQSIDAVKAQYPKPECQQ